jgi:hypothetical protein
MAGKTTTWCDSILNWFAVPTTYPATIATAFVALMTTNPTIDDMTSAVETTYTNYARPSITNSSVGWNAPANGSGSTRQITNKLALNFGTAGSGPVTITGFAVCQHVSTSITTAGEAIYWNVLTGGNQVINNGNPVTAAVAALVINED